MYKYKNEAAFSKSLVKALRAKYWFVQRIETGTTGRGVPDIYAISPKFTPIWLELKRVHQSLGARERAKIPWREGQQSWLYTVCRQFAYMSYPLCAFDDCVLQIKHDVIWKDDVVEAAKCRRYFSIGELIC